MDQINFVPIHGEVEYEILFLLRDNALLYNRMNPNNKYLLKIAKYIDIYINKTVEEMNIYEDK